MKAVTKDYNRLSTAELDQLLRDELDKDSPDRDTAMELLHILEQRDKAESALPEETGSMNKPRRKGLWVAAVAAAVVLTVSIAVPTVIGNGRDEDLIGRWKDRISSLFHPDRPTEPEETYVFETDNVALQQIYNTVTGFGVEGPAVPMWVPEGCELTEMKVVPVSGGTNIETKLENDSNKIIFRFSYSPDAALPMYHSKDEGLMIYECNEITHFLSINNGLWTAVWYTENTECNIMTSCNQDELQKMLKSLYSGG